MPNRDTHEVTGVDATGHIIGRYATGLADPFVVCAWNGRLYVADFGGTDVLSFRP